MNYRCKRCDGVISKGMEMIEKPHGRFHYYCWWKELKKGTQNGNTLPKGSGDIPRVPDTGIEGSIKCP